MIEPVYASTAANQIGIPLKLSSSKTIELLVLGRSLRDTDGAILDIPNNATAVSLNVTAATPTGPRFITVWPCGVARPLASNLNFVAADIVPNDVIASIGNNGSVCFF